jgi:membrane protein YdbS with pleckstrin-like domain
MYCPKCGKENPDDAVFCQKCGTLIEPEEETRVAGRGNQTDWRQGVEWGPAADTPGSDWRAGDIGRRQGADRRPAANAPGADMDQELTVFSISPTLLFVKLGYGLAVLAAILLVAFFSLVFPAVPWWVAVLIGLLLLLVPAYFHFEQKLVKYTLTESKIEIDTGLISRITRNVPLGRIQDVTISSTIPQRLLGFGDIVIDNASEQGGKIVLKNINSPRRYADMLLKQVHRLER